MAILRESRHCAVDADSFRFGDIERIHPTEALDQLECGRFAHDIDQVVILRQTLWDVQAHATVAAYQLQRGALCRVLE
ncbi:hypothetical protein SAMN05421754_10396 [Nitrosomonas sp. Nm58]|nr:hypothetical protein SAMN05421754_10396 [Nitrosomonas sp. Nm58]